MVTQQQAPTFEVASYAQVARGQRADLRRLAEPLPPSLAELLPAKVRREHEQLVGRTEAARAEAAAAAAAVEAAGQADRAERVAAASTGRAAAPLTLPAAEAARAEADEVALAHEIALGTSANALLEQASAKAAEATANVVQAIGDEKRRQLELVEAAIAAGVRAAELEHELGWLRRLDGAARVQPFAAAGRPSSGLDNGLRLALAAAAEDERKAAERVEEQKRAEAYLAEQEQRARQAASAAATPG